MRAVAIVQARIGSHRLPGKVMRQIGGKTMLERVCDQVARIQWLDQWVVAVPMADAVHFQGRVPHLYAWDGPDTNVLGRYAAAAKFYQADIVMRITSDCPLLDPEVASSVLANFLRDPGSGYRSNVRPVRLHPDGCDVEVFTRELLEERAREARTPEEWEHVTIGMPAKWGVVSSWPCGADLRWTVDTEADLEFVREVYRGLESRGLPVSIENVLSLTPGDACEHCAAKVPHVERMGRAEGQTVWELHQVEVGTPDCPYPPMWARDSRATDPGRIFLACEAWELARWGGTRRRA